MIVEPLVGAFRAGGVYVVPPRGRVDVPLHFRPDAAGEHEATLRVRTSDPALAEAQFRCFGEATGP